MLFSQAPFSTVPFSSKFGVSFNATIALAPASPTIAINESEIEGAAVISLTPAIPIISIAGVFFSASIALTQGAASINLANYNGIAPWQAAPVDNTRRRQEAPMLQEIRQVAPELKQIRQSLPMLGD